MRGGNETQNRGTDCDLLGSPQKQGKRRSCAAQNWSLPEDLPQHHSLAAACRRSPRGTRSGRPSPRPRAAAAAGGATRAAGGWLPRGSCPSPTWQGPPRAPSSRTAAGAQSHVTHPNSSATAHLPNTNPPRFSCCRKHLAGQAEWERFLALNTHKALCRGTGWEGADHLLQGCSALLLAPAEGRNAWPAHHLIKST